MYAIRRVSITHRPALGTDPVEGLGIHNGGRFVVGRFAEEADQIDQHFTGNRFLRELWMQLPLGRSSLPN